MNRTVVSILGIGHSGSHYLSLLLGSHSKGMHLGEVHYLGKSHPSKRKKVCARCGDDARCPIFGEVGHDNIDRAYEIIFSKIDPGVTALVDISKDIRWFRRFMGRTQFTMKYIHLIREPQAFIRLWDLTYTSRWRRLHTRLRDVRALPHLAPTLLFGDIHEVYLYDWLVRNQEITRFIEQHRLDACVVSYRDLATNPGPELERIMRWLGLPYEPSQLEYWNIEHHGTQKQDYEWVKKAKTQYIDMRWQTDLPKELIERVNNHPALTAYVRRMGLMLTENGLVRAPAPARPDAALLTTPAR